MIELTIILPTYNPNYERLQQTLNGLKNQTVEPSVWELIIVDNNSASGFEKYIDLSWHKCTKIIFEPKQGLTNARIKGFLEAQGEIVILVDDDNVLDKNYLEKTLEIFETNPRIGTIGGKSIPQFESAPPLWTNTFHESLALRDRGENIILEDWRQRYPENAPIGAGMAIRKEALKSYIKKNTSNNYFITDRVGKSLSSGGDNDIVLEIIKSGWQTGYFPSLTLFHIIPKERLSVQYLARLINNSNKSWIQLLENHNINPWAKIAQWTVPLRKFKAWFVYKAWLGKTNYIKWRGACGMFDGMSA